MTARYVVFLWCFLAARQRMYRELTAAQRESIIAVQPKVLWAGAFGVEASGQAGEGTLQRKYEWIIANRLQPPSFGRHAAEAMLTTHIGGIPGPDLAREAATIPGPRTDR